MEAAQSRVNPSRQSDAIQHFKYSALLPLFEAAADTETESGSVSSDLLYNFIVLGLGTVAAARQPNQLSMSSAVTRLQSALGLGWDDTHHSDTGGNISEN